MDGTELLVDPLFVPVKDEADLERVSEKTNMGGSIEGTESREKVVSSKYIMRRDIDVSESLMDPLFVTVKAEPEFERTSEESVKKEEDFEASEITKEFCRDNKSLPHMEHSTHNSSLHNGSSSTRCSPDTLQMDSGNYFLKNSFTPEHETVLLAGSESNDPLAVVSLSSAHDTVSQEEAAERCLWKGCVEQQVVGESHCDLTDGNYEEIHFQSEPQQSGSLISFTNKSHFKCTQCGSAFEQDTLLTQHMRTHTEEMPFKCSQCGISFSHSTHMRVHTEEKRFNCSECGKPFKRRDNLVCHMKSHRGEKPFRCNQCGKSLTRSSSLTAHMRVHTEERTFKCNECGKSFKYNKDLSYHIRIHRGEKPYKCKQCGRAFNRSTHLNGHMRTHTKEMPYKCSQCGKSFADSSNLSQHIRAHTGDRPYKCLQCGKSFTRSGYLTDHLFLHTRGGPSYECSQCAKSFTQRGSLTKHMRFHTEDQH